MTEHNNTEQGWTESALDREILVHIHDQGSIKLQDFNDFEADTHDVLNRVQLLLGYGLLNKQSNRIALTTAGREYLIGDRPASAFELD